MKGRQETAVISRRFWNILRQEWSAALVAAGLGMLTIAAGLGLMTTSAWLIATAALQPSVTELSVAIVGVRFFGISRAVLRYLERYISHDAVFRLLGALRVWFYQTLEPLGPAGIGAWQRGDLAARMTADVEVLKYFYLRVLFPALAAVLVAGTALLAATLAPAEFFVLLAGLFLLSGLVLPYGTWRWSRRQGEGYSQDRDQLNAALADTLEGIGELTISGRQQDQLTLLARLEAQTATSRRLLRQGTFAAGAVNRLTLDVAVLGVVFLATPLVRDGTVAGVWLPVAALAVQSLGEALLPLPLCAYYLAESRLALVRLFGMECKDDKAETKVAIGTGFRHSAASGLEVNGLFFRYQSSGPWALENISFRVPVGGRLIIAGSSGSGKSTLAAIVSGLWRPTAGFIYLAGECASQREQEWLRAQWGVVSQDTYIFDASVADNVRLARPGASADDLTAALLGAGLDSWLKKLPQGLDTRIGQNGLAISGGERQRLALARVLLKDAPFLLLDEPTAGLDPIAEQQMLAQLSQIMAGRTTLLITHRLTDLKDEDEVLVLERGRVTEQGPRSHLLAGAGLFRRLWNVQQNFINADFHK